jgi:MoxR-like ATPase
MSYQPLFDPDTAVPFDPERAYRLGDRAEASEQDRYEYDDRIVLAVNVALAAGRPLLVRGEPGTGKSSLACSVARRLGWRFYAATVSSRTTARDLLWTFDSVARLADAQARRTRPRLAYITPGPLWWAFNPASAHHRGVADDRWDKAVARGVTPAVDPAAPVTHERAVVLVDEIDKADPDVPNDLLVPLGSFTFTLDDGPTVVAAAAPLVVLTTNEERDLPRAFLRRCVVLALEDPDTDRLRRIALRHFPDLDGTSLLDGVLAEYTRVREERQKAFEQPPGVAELLDALAACRNLRTGPTTGDWPGLVELLLAKPGGMRE